jgi:glycosyltransferase involved in cell wall biosynthesis
MRILIVTQYYPPETGAPQNRLSSLAANLQRQGVEVEILTALPNYPDGKVFAEYRWSVWRSETVDGISIKRCFVIPSKSLRISRRLICYFSFAISALLFGLFRTRRADVVICESPPLFLGVTAWLLAKTKGAKFVFNVSDLWPASVEELSVIRHKWLLRPAYWLEAFLYRRSNLVSGQTQGIVRDIVRRFPDTRTHWLPNGIDRQQFSSNPDDSAHWREQNGIQTDDFLVMYAGVLGAAQGLQTLLDAAKTLQHDDRVYITIVGDGPERDVLQSTAKEHGLRNVKFIDRQSREQMPAVVGACDAFVVPLKKLSLFRGAIPSKIFEPLALAKPVILGVEGEAKELFMDEARAGVAYEPENASALAAAIEQLRDDASERREMGKRGQQYVFERFDRREIACSFLQHLQVLLGVRRRDGDHVGGESQPAPLRAMWTPRETESV